jgi:hypothetical protein
MSGDSHKCRGLRSTTPSSAADLIRRGKGGCCVCPKCWGLRSTTPNSTADILQVIHKERVLVCRTLLSPASAWIACAGNDVLNTVGVRRSSA